MLRKALLGFLILLLGTSWGLTTQPGVAAAARPLARVAILPVASHTDGGRSVTIRVRIMCVPDGTNQWEGAFYSTKPKMDAGGVALPCDGRPHIRNIVLRGTDVFTGNFLTVHAFIIDENNFLTVEASDTRTVKLRQSTPCLRDWPVRRIYHPRASANCLVHRHSG